jgi:valyl-tRNA synthetase
VEEGRVAGAGGGRIQVFTTRVETIMGCTFIAVPVETRSGKIRGYCRHPLTQ